MQQLVDRAIQGDSKAEQEFLARLRVRFLTLAKHRVETADAEDLVQEACLTVLEKYKTLSGEQPFDAWAYQILRHKIGNYYRRRESQRQVMESGPSSWSEGSTQAADPLLENKLIGCLRRMMESQPKYARIINLVHQGYTVEEICRRVKCKRPHFYVLLSRGRKQLRACLKGELLEK